MKYCAWQYSKRRVIAPLRSKANILALLVDKIPESGILIVQLEFYEDAYHNWEPAYSNNSSQIWLPLPLSASSPAVEGPQEKRMTLATKPLPRSLIEGAKVNEKVNFDVTKHVNFVPPSKIYTMKDIGLEGQGITDTAVSEPFPLWTPEAVAQTRAELFSPEVLATNHISSSFASDQIRGYCPDKAPFIYDAWNSPEVLRAVSSVAGIDLVPVCPLEIGHTNVSVPDETEQQQQQQPPEESKPAFAWHHDSYPFVCVTTLSDCSAMEGGETEILLGNGDTKKVRGPSVGTAVVMQGRYIRHQALKAIGGKERISHITPFRPRSPFIKDESILATVRGISSLSELYHQYTLYRLENQEARIRAQLQRLRERHETRRDFDLAQVRDYLYNEREFLDFMLREVRDV
ncbi:hypothetical protein H2202_009501 [Exophiala xenobiotica]|nr:hypothetical protein H2202_009501 [Exophiala xenobiotica]